ncbi:methylated-DNA--[protein]-cysteine S-methyltransferase [Tumebacillus lipolyticus]|uniref:Methylated-DNA--[protein]-cysteine S-methyltransferase n=1 Tax=Tumebacillus lipolyticus TaxID=1280370 RepID=A0ABW5A205_9BACL
MSQHTVFYTTIRILEQDWILFATEKGMCRIQFPHEPLESALPWLNRHLSNVRLQEDPAVFEQLGILSLLSAYFAGEPVEFDQVPIDLWGTPFQIDVWTELGRIPYGATRSYRDVAEAIGRPQAVRAVGAANGANPLPLLLPCHRVIGADRKLTGYRGGLNIKLALLELEGVDQVEPVGHARFGF